MSVPRVRFFLMEWSRFFPAPTRVRGFLSFTRNYLAALFVLVAGPSSHCRTTSPDHYVMAVFLDLRRGLTAGLGC